MTSESSASPWQKTAAITIVFFIAREIKRLVTNFSNFVPLLALGVVGGKNMADWVPWAIAGAYLIGTVVVAILHWHYYRFQWDDATIRIRSGIVNKEHLTLKFERIQQAELKQAWYLRPFGRTILAVDSAGSKGQEVEIPGLELAVATDLRQQMLATQHVTTAPNQADSASLEETDAIRLPFAEVVRAGLIDNMAFVVLAVIVYPLSQLKVFENYIEPYLEAHASELADNGWVIGIASVLSVFILMLLLSVLASIIRYYGFTLQLSGRGLKRKFQARSGLFTIRTLSFQYQKLQRVRIRQNIRGKLLKRWAFSARQLQPQQNKAPGAGGRQVFGVPAATAELIAQLRSEFKLPANQKLPWRRLSPFALLGKSLWLALLTPIAAITIYLNSGELIALVWVALAYVVLQAIIIGRWWRFGWLETGDWLAIRKGLFGEVQLWYPRHKLQQIDIRQGPLLRMLSYAHLTYFGAAGSQTLAYFPLKRAQQLQHQWLEHVAQSRQPWF
ncbi:PH domain-containing protein [Pseudidiomarina taiwanensis]|nr:PH domain-containing protein [Pseudidiomarina taiwanensis]